MPRYMVVTAVRLGDNVATVGIVTHIVWHGTTVTLNDVPFPSDRFVALI